MQEQTTTVPPSVLSHRPFLFLWLGRIVSVFAYQMTMVALAWQLYDITNSALALGFVGLAQFLPLIFFTLPVGYVSDRYDRRKVVRLCQLGAGCCALVLVAGTLGGMARQHFHLRARIRDEQHALVRISGDGRDGAEPRSGGRRAAGDGVVHLRAEDRDHRRSRARRLSLYSRPRAWCTASRPFFWVAASMLMMLIVTQRVVPKKEPVTLESLFAGFRYLLRDRILFGTASLDMFAVLVGGITVLLPIFARDILHTGPWGLGLLRSSPALGALLMSLVLARYPLKPPVGPILFGVTILFGIATVGFALSTNLILSMLALAIMGGSDVVSVVIRMSLVQLRTPDDMRGRVGAANALFIGASNQLGDFESGAVAALVGAVPAVIIGGVGHDRDHHRLDVVPVPGALSYPGARQRRQDAGGEAEAGIK